MSKKNEDYWKERFIQLEEARNKQSVKTIQAITEEIEKAQQTIEKQIYEWYGRLAANNGISMQEARKLLAANELKEFKWTVQEYIKYGEENAINQMWMKQLENASARVHISRLEQIKLQIQQELEKLYGNQLDLIDNHIKNIYADGYYKTIFEIQQGFSIGWNIASLNTNEIEDVIKKPWAVDKKNFSDRIWTNKQKLIDTLHTNITQMCILGQQLNKTIDSVKKAMNVSRAQAGRLVMTESAYFGTIAQQKSFNELDVEEYEIVATLDSRTSEICRELDGKHFPMKEFNAGVTAPPFHVNCRTCICPYFNDEFTIGERAARDEDGNTYYVPSNMTYNEWKNKFVDGKSVEKDKNSGIIKTDKQFGKKIGKHAKEYELDPSKQEDRNKMMEIIEDIIDNRDELKTGNWRGQEGNVNFYIKGQDVVVVKGKEFITILKGGVNNARVKNARKREI